MQSQKDFRCLSCLGQFPSVGGNTCDCAFPEESHYILLPDNPRAAATKRIKLAVDNTLRGNVVSINPEESTFLYLQPVGEGENEGIKRYRVTVEEL